MKELRIAAVSRSYSNVCVGWGEKFSARPQLLKDEIKKLIDAGNKYIVVSHENSLGRPFKRECSHLYPNAKNLAESYRDHLQEFNPLMVFYTRSQSSFLQSYYIQTVHEGSTKSFREWYDPIQQTIELSWLWSINALRSTNFLTVIKKFEDLSSGGQEDYIASFLKIFLPTEDLPKFKYLAKRNISVGDIGLKMLLKCNKHVRTNAERKLLRKFFQENFNNTNYPRPTLLNDREIDYLDKLYIADHCALQDS